nr:retrovirus-related Pol polyprotein from transposon TNT 1-94 [Tanacetum cinerariifolium]
MNSVINFLTNESTWDDLILYHEGPSDVKESEVMDLKLCYNTFKFKEASKAATVKNKGLIAEAYKWEEEEMSSDGNEMVEVKVLMSLVEDNDAIIKEGARNGEWMKISMRKASAIRPLFLTIAALEAEVPKLRRASLALTLLYLTLNSLVGLTLDKQHSSWEKGKHHRASFKIKQTSSIKKCLYFLHMDLFGSVTPRSINHEKYTLVIVDEYSSPSRQMVSRKHIELVNIISNPGVGMLTIAMAKQLSAALAHKCLFVDFLSEEEPIKVSEALWYPGWFDAMQDELN